MLIATKTRLLTAEDFTQSFLDNELSGEIVDAMRFPQDVEFTPESFVNRFKTRFDVSLANTVVISGPEDKEPEEWTCDFDELVMVLDISTYRDESGKAEIITDPQKKLDRLVGMTVFLVQSLSPDSIEVARDQNNPDLYYFDMWFD